MEKDTFDVLLEDFESSTAHEAESATATAGQEQEKKRKKRGFWYTFIGVLGELLITLGVLLGLFIVWQVWWTNVQATQQINAEVEEIHKEYGDPLQKAAPPQEGEPPVVNPVGTGQSFAVIHIPALGYDHQTPIKEGTNQAVLDSGAFGHYNGTAMPGELGNFAMAVHREIYGARMLHVDELEVGTPIVIETKDAYYVYNMIGHDLVLPTGIHVIQPDPFAAKVAFEAGQPMPSVTPTRRLLTITTCHPLYVSSHRWAVQAEFSYWVKRSDGMPKELIDPNATASADDASNTLALATVASDLATVASDKEN